jgi:type IV pilus assembly protein PilE
MSERRTRGWTLLELLLVALLLALLAALALPSYQAQLRRGLRAEADVGLLQASHWLEQFASAAGHYPTQAAALPERLRGVPSGAYRIEYEPAHADGSGYTLTALPQGAQAADRCGAFTLDHSGRRGLAAAGASHELQAECLNH